MSQVGAKLRSLQRLESEALCFWCPGCNMRHQVRITGPHAWTWDGNVDRPTFAPSVLVQGVQRITDDEHRRIMAGERIEPRPLRCHSFVRAGRIEFLADCTHELRGQTIDLPDLPQQQE